jgi:hypothetical protein
MGEEVIQVPKRDLFGVVDLKIDQIMMHIDLVAHPRQHGHLVGQLHDVLLFSQAPRIDFEFDHDFEFVRDGTGFPVRRQAKTCEGAGLLCHKAFCACCAECFVAFSTTCLFSITFGRIHCQGERVSSWLRS